MMNAFIRFMASPAGRILRIVAGSGIIAWGLLVTGGTDGMVIAAVGAVPILTGALNICVVGPLVGGPLSGSKARATNS
jgi:hypothetical protein